MQSSWFRWWLIVCVCLNVTALSGFAEMRTWTGRSGSVMNAELASVSGDGSQVELRTADGSIVKANIANLSAPDQKYIKQIQAESSLSPQDRVLASMQTIVIPEIDFRQANLRDVLAFLSQQSVEHDPAHRGVVLLFKESLDPSAQASTESIPESILVTFNAREITLKETLDITVDIAGLKYLIIDGSVIILPKDAPEGELIVNRYLVVPGAIAFLTESLDSIPRGHDEASRGGHNEIKGFFSEVSHSANVGSIDWPTGSDVYFQGTNQVVIKNTKYNIRVFELCLDNLNMRAPTGSK